jgi:hypothetical protein
MLNPICFSWFFQVFTASSLPFLLIPSFWLHSNNVAFAHPLIRFRLLEVFSLAILAFILFGSSGIFGFHFAVVWAARFFWWTVLELAVLDDLFHTWSTSNIQCNCCSVMCYVLSLINRDPMNRLLMAPISNLLWFRHLRISSSESVDSCVQESRDNWFTLLQTSRE